MPALKTLDFNKVKPSERDRAHRLARSAAGAPLESDVQQEAKTFVPGQGLDEESHGSMVSTMFTAQDKEDIRQLLANASSAKELEEIENAVKRGVLPPALKRRRQEEEVVSGENGRHGPEADNGDECNPNSKRARTDDSAG
jgi:hypothetical protein